jgi:TP901 family phage tail tape measure protein
VSEPTEREFKGKITLEFNAKDIQRYIDALAEVSTDSRTTQKAIESLEKALASQGKAAGQAASGIKKYIAQYEAFARVRPADDKAGPLNQQFPLFRQKLKELEAAEREHVKSAQGLARERLAVEEATRRKELAALRARIQDRARMQDIIDRDHARALKENERREAEAKKQALAQMQITAQQENRLYDQRVKSAQDLARERLAAEEDARRKELASLRAHIQERAKESIVAEKRQIADAQGIARARLAAEEDARRKELASFRAHIQERARMEDIRNRDHIRAIKENAQREAAARKKAQDDAYATYASNIRYTQQQERFYSELPRARYALYDVAQTWGMVSAATLGAAAAVGSVGIAYQREFAQVARTTGVTGEAAQQLRRDLEDLSTTIPESFSSISEIASLGGQLGIAADGIDEFTSVTARLTATTNLSAEAAGTALGRFQALLGVPSSQFENLASSILKVGVNSVATETQIVQIATQISSMGAFAGLTADQVVGLAGALASTGTQPELARGTITRTFTLMSEAVAGTTDKLDEFARVADVSAEDFRRAWGTSEFADVFQKFLQGIAREGEAAVETLHGLGITSVRDVPALMRLADAGEVVTNAFADAESGFREGTELAEQYGVVSETVAAKLTKLGNTLQTIFANIVDDSSLNILGRLLDLVQGLANAFLEFSRNPFGKAAITIVGAITVLVGVFAAARSASAMFTASLYALITAQRSLATTSAALGLTTRQLMMNFITTGNAVGGATAATRGFTIALRTMQSVTVVGAVLTGLAIAFEAFSSKAERASERAKELFGGLEGLADAMREDGKIFAETGEGVEYVTRAIEETDNSTNNAIPTLERWRGALDDAGQSTDNVASSLEGVPDKINEVTFAIGQNTAALIANALAGDEDFVSTWQKYGQDIENLGFSLDSFMQQIAAGGGALNYINMAIAEVDRQLVALQPEIDAVNGNLALLDENTKSFYTELIRANAGLRELKESAEAVDTGLADAATKSDILASLQRALGVAAADAGDEFSQLGDNAIDAANAILEAANASLAAENAIFNLGASIHENGLDFSNVTEAGRANLSALMQTVNALVAETVANGGNAADAIAGLMEALSLMGVNVARDLAFLADMVAKLGGTSGMGAIADAAERAVRGINQGFGSVAPRAMNRTRDAAREVKEEIRTVADYADELASVLTDAFNFRFGQQKAKDKTASLWADWEQEIKNAKERAKELRLEIRGIRAETATLQARRSVLSYQLDVARMFGDEQRVEQILAEMGEVDSELANNKHNLTKAIEELQAVQDTLNPSLKGNSEAAREQRERVMELIESYKDQIEEAARNGASQEELAELVDRLKGEFEEQAEQIGLTQGEIDEYKKAFDDMDEIVKKVPRKVTTEFDFKANASPAEKALTNFKAKVEKERKKIEKPFKLSAQYDSKVNSNINSLKAAQQALAEALRSQAKAYREQPNGGTRVDYWDNKVNYWRRIVAQYKGYAAGGFTGRGGKFEEAGVVHRGEFVFPKEYVNQSTGLPYANVLGSMAHAMGAGSRSSASPNQIQLVELLPNQLEELARAVSTRVAIDGRVVAAVSNNYNSAQRARGAG